MAKLVSKKIINQELVYDISVEDTHNFYANNILVHNCVSKSSAQSKNLLKLKSNYKVAMTGTPITSTPMSAYVALSWTENDKATLTNYKSLYCQFGGFNNSQIIGYKNLEILKEELDSCSIRRTFAQIKGDMPEKLVEYELIEMSEEHQKFYNAIKDGVKEEADKIVLNPNNTLALATRLRQATSSPRTLTSQNIESSKIERCVELAEELLSQNEKLVIFCNFIDSVGDLAKRLERFNPVLATGAQTDDYISSGIDKFRNTSTTNLLIGTHNKCGTGFSFPECHYMIMLDQPFSEAQQTQSMDRIYRLTSKEPVFIKILLCKDTFDERVKDIVDTKRDLADFVIDDIETERFNSKLKNALLESLK